MTSRRLAGAPGALGALGACGLLLTTGGLSGSSLAIEWPGRVRSLELRVDRGDPDLRAESIAELGALSPEEATSVLAPLLSDPSPVVRAAAAVAAGECGAVALAPQLVLLLQDRSAEVRLAAAGALANLRVRDAAEPIARLLGDSDATVRRGAVSALGQLGSREAVLAIVGVLGDRDRDVVVEALETLGALGQPEATFALLERTDDPVEEIAVAAISALESIRAPEAIPAFVELISSPRAAVSVAAISAVASLDAEEAVSALTREVLSPGGVGTGEAAAEALARIADPRALDVLVPLLSDRFDLVAPIFEACGPGAWPVLQREVRRVGGSGPAGPGLLRLWLRSGDPEAVDAIRGFLAVPGFAESQSERIGWLLESPTPGAFCDAAGSMVPSADSGEMRERIELAGRADAVDCLCEALDSWELVSPSEWIPLAESLSSVGSTLAMELIEARMGRGPLSLGEGTTAVASLLRFGTAGAHTLTELLADSDPRLRREAAFALGGISAPWIDPNLLHGWAHGVGRHAEAWIALSGQLHGDHRAEILSLALEAAAEGAPSVRVQALDLLRDDCDVAHQSPWFAALTDGDYWVRRAAWSLASECGWLAASDWEIPDAASVPDPWVRALALAGERADALMAIARDPERAEPERLMALQLLQDTAGDLGWAAEWVGDASPAVAAAAWLLHEQSGASPVAPGEIALAAIASPWEVERRALEVILYLRGETEWLQRARRGAEADGSTGGSELIESVGEDGLLVFLVGGAGGEPQQDETLMLVDSAGRFRFARTDSEGRVRVPPGIGFLGVTPVSSRDAGR